MLWASGVIGLRYTDGRAEDGPLAGVPSARHWGGLEIPNFCILYARDVLLSPRQAAAPRAPPTTQLLSPSVCTICSRSVCSRACHAESLARVPNLRLRIVRLAMFSATKLGSKRC